MCSYLLFNFVVAAAAVIGSGAVVIDGGSVCHHRCCSHNQFDSKRFARTAGETVYRKY